MSVVPAVELAEVARLADGDEDPTHVLQRIVDHAVSLVPGCTGAGLTIATREGLQTAAVSDDRVRRCHDAQFREGGDGPAVEALQYGEPRHLHDLDRETRWPGFADEARACGFASCLVLPLVADDQAATALNLYAARPDVFVGTTFDVAMLFAAQGGVALHNADLYRQAKELAEHLHRTLTTRSLIERAKGLLMARLQVGSEEAFEMLRTESQRSHRKLPDVAVGLLREHDPEHFGTDVPWTPVRAPSPRPGDRGDADAPGSE